MVNSAADCFLQGEDLAAFVHNAAQPLTNITATKGAYVLQLKRKLLFMCNWTETWSYQHLSSISSQTEGKKSPNTKGQFIFSFLSIFAKFLGC